MIHKAFNRTELSERYYKAIGKFSTRAAAKNNFRQLKKPDLGVLKEIISEINNEQNMLFEQYLKRRK